MKTKVLLTVVLLSLLVSCHCKKSVDKVTICNCDNKTVTDKNVVQSVGVIKYNKELQCWTIQYSPPNTIDEKNIYIPCNLEDKNKIENQQVTFSGSIFPLTQLVIAPAGESYYCLLIHEISLN